MLRPAGSDGFDASLQKYFRANFLTIFLNVQYFIGPPKAGDSSSIFIGPRCPWGPIYGSGCLSVSLSPRPFADLTDVTLVDEDTKSILTDNANRAIQGNQAMHVT